MEKELKKELNLLDVFCISVGAMISSGLFILPGLAFSKAGPAVVVSYVLAGIFALPTLFSKSELASAMPKAGGGYFYIARGFGPLLGTIAGIAMWFSLSMKGTFALLGMGTYLGMLTDMPIKLIAVICCIIFILVNLVSTKHASRVQVYMVVALLVILFTYIFKGLLKIDSSRFSPFFANGIAPVFSTASYVFISYGGFVKIPSLAEETKNPARNIPLGMMLSLIVTGIIYALVVMVTVGVTESSVLEGSRTPIYAGAQMIGGNIFTIIIVIGALLAFITTTNSAIMTAPRYPLSMSRDKLMPKSFQNISTKFGTPYVSIIFTGIVMILFIFMELEALVKLASALLVFSFILINLAVILFRESKIISYKPTARSPFYPYMQAIGIIGGGFMLVEMGTFVVFQTFLFILIGFLWYMLYAKKTASKDSALIYFLEGLLSKDKELASENLLEELKNIVIQRDDVIRDKVHTLFEESSVLDFDEELKMDEFFKVLSEVAGKSLGIDPYTLYDKFIIREQEACTVMRKGLAIPHIIIDGENIFKIIIARAKKGVIFPGDKRARIIFATIGSIDKRDLHLKVLAAIAETTENPSFDSQWFEVSNKEELKHIVLLAERRRG